MNRLAACLLATAFVCAVDAQGAEKSTLSEDSVLETVLVVGVQPGPALWKVSKGDHVIWILGTYSPLPKQMTWNSAEAETRLAASQEILFPGGVRSDTDVGFFTSVGSLPLMLRAGKNPDGATLHDVLPAEVYSKWRVLQEKYMPHDTVDRMRPPFAAQSLTNNAYPKIGLGGDAGVIKEIRRLAKRHKLKVIALPNKEVEIKIKGAREALKKYSRTPLAGVECLSRMVDQFEADFATLTERANAWATGDIASFRQLRDVPLAPNCVQETINSLLMEGFEKGSAMEAVIDRYRKEMESAVQQQANAWLDATESALAKNKSTFAVMRIESLLRPDGYLSRMRERGYSVEEPDGR